MSPCVFWTERERESFLSFACFYFLFLNRDKQNARHFILPKTRRRSQQTTNTKRNPGCNCTHAKKTKRKRARKSFRCVFWNYKKVVHFQHPTLGPSSLSLSTPTPPRHATPPLLTVGTLRSSLAAALLGKEEEEEEGGGGWSSSAEDEQRIDVPMPGSPSSARSTCPGLLMLNTTQSMPFSAASVNAVPSITASFLEETSAYDSERSRTAPAPSAPLGSRSNTPSSPSAGRPRRPPRPAAPRPSPS